MKLWAPGVVIAALLSSSLLAGCGATLSSTEEIIAPVVPITPVVPGTTPIGHLKGSVLGGGVPITGAKVFLYAASTAGYGITTAGATGQRSTSLLTVNSQPTQYPIAQDTVTTDIAYGDYYVTTDSGGNFNISGDYTCVPGTQLYLLSLGGNTTQNYPGGNSAAGLITALPQCPSSGTLAGSKITFIYMNEVGTVAAAYAMAGFAHDAVHVGAPTGTPATTTDALALMGIKNAFANAGNLYNFGPVTPGSSALASSDGITRPQATVDTLANILQYCINTIDSGGISNACTNLFSTATGAGNTGQTVAGTTSTVATAETATAAIFMAQHPGTNVSSLYGYALTSGSAFLPKLTAQPNDLTVALFYSGGGIKNSNAGSGSFYTSPSGLAIDSAGNAWVTNFQGSSVSVFSPLGAPLSGTGGFSVGNSVNTSSVAIDTSGYAWITDENAAAISKMNATTGTMGTVQVAYGTAGYSPFDAQLDASGNVWIASYYNTADNPYGALEELTPSTGNYVYYNDTSSSNLVYDMKGVGVAPSGLIWAVSTGTHTTKNVGTSYQEVTFNSSLTPQEGVNGFTNLSSAGGIAFDASGNAWIPESATYMGKQTAAYTASNYKLATPAIGQAYVQPLAVTIDGNGNVWTTDLDLGSIYELNNSGTQVSPTYGYTVPGNSGYSTTSPTIVYSTNGIAADPSGNIWYEVVPESSTSTPDLLVELIGAATPVATPIAYGLANSKLGTRP